MRVSSADNDLGDFALALGLSEANIQLRRDLVGLTDQDRRILRDIAPVFDRGAKAFSERLYNRFRAEPELAMFVASDARIGQLRKMQENYLSELVSSELDSTYVFSRLRVGLVHQRLRLTPPWYLATFSHFICDHIDTIFSAANTSLAAMDCLCAFVKTCFFDASISLQAYGHTEEEKILASAQENFTQSELVEFASEATPTQSAPSEISRIRVSENLVRARYVYIGLNKDLQVVLASLEETIVRSATKILADFYEWLFSNPETAALIPASATERLRLQVASYWRECARAKFDSSYAASRMRIGIVHERLGLVPHLYLAALSRQLIGFLRALDFGDPYFVERAKTLVRTVFFDITFVIDAYMEARVEQLLRREGLANRLVHSSASAVAVVDKSRRVRSVNNAFLRILGIDPAILYLMPITQALPMSEVERLLNRLRDEKIPRAVEMTHSASRSYRVTAMELSGASKDESLSHAVVLDDITELIGIADRYERGDLSLETIVSETRTIVWEADALSGAILSMSRASLDVLGHRDIYFLGRSAEWLGCVDGADRQKFMDLWNTIAPGERAELDHRMIHASGKTVFVRSVFARPLHGFDRPLVFGLTIDVTELKEVKRDHLEARSDAHRLGVVNTIGKGVSHDFGNALALVSSHLEQARPGIAEPSTIDLIDKALTATRIALNLSRRLLSFAQSSEPMVITRNINLWVAETVDLLGPLLGQKLTIDLRVATDVWPTKFNRPDFESALVNLIINARDAMPDGGVVVVQTRNVEGGDISAAPVSRRFVCISVKDFGAGISDDVVDRIGEPFFSKKPGGAHAGLGIFGVKMALGRANGFLTVESEIGEGSEFSLYLPAIEDGQNETGGESRDLLGNGEVVLLIEPEEDLRKNIARILEGLFYAVVPVRNLKHALAVIELGEPVVVIVTRVQPGDLSIAEGLAAAPAHRESIKVLNLCELSHGDERQGVSDGPSALERRQFKIALAEALKALLTP